jgi:hypothetical protein
MQEIPFWQAYYANFGSIEADVFLVKGKLWVAHTEKNFHQTEHWRIFIWIIFLSRSS